MYRIEQLPVNQNRIFRSEEDARNCVTGNIDLVEDPSTGLISNRAFRPELMQYDADYHTEQLSSVFQAHLRNVSGIILRHFSGLSLIEVGCGKGHFLEVLQASGFEITGLDPSYDGPNQSIRREYFSAESGLSGGAVILRHVLEHVQNPVTFLSNIRDANGGKGKVYIEVPCFDWICKHRAWFDIFYEHVNYFRLPDFHRMFGSVYEVGHLFNGQYLYVVADLATLRNPVSGEPCRFEFPTNFLDGVNRCAALWNERQSSDRAVWGAASKGVIFALLMKRANAAIDLIIDINPAKQGRFLPVTGIQVQSPEAAMNVLSPGAAIFVMNGNYVEEIRASTKNRFTYLTVEDVPGIR